MNNRQIGRLYNILLLAGLYVVAPFLWLAKYNQPSADDYYSAVRDTNTNFLSILKDVYLHWSGRYFAVLVSRLNPLLFHSAAGYKWYAVVLILLFITTLLLLIRQVAERHLALKQVIALIAVISTIYFATMPSVPEGFYWFSGAWVYQLANILFMLLLVFVIKLKRAASPASRFCCFLCAAVCTVFVVGCNEISLIITCLTVSFFAIHHCKKHKTGSGYFIALAITCYIAASLAAFAPGNFERLNHQQEYSGSLLWTFAGGAAIAGVYTAQWLLQVFIATFIYIPLWGNELARKMAGKQEWSEIKLKHIIIFFITSLAIVQLFTVWAAGGSNIGRIENVIYLFFVLGYFFVLQVYLVQHAQKIEGEALTINPVIRNIAIFLFIIALFDVNNNISTAWLDVVSGKAKKYNQQLDERAVLASRCVQDTCLVPPLTTIPKTIFFTDIKSTTNSIDLWMNKSYSTYFGHGYIVTSGPLPQPQQNMETLKNLGREMREDVFR